jgi:hypothetical protein
MFVRRNLTRVAVAGVSTALAAGGLVGAASTSANAAEITGTYACSALGNPVGNFPLTVSVPLLPPTAPAGMPIPAGLLSATAGLVAPTTLLTGAGIDGGSVDDFAMTIGSQSISAPLAVTGITDNGDGTSTIAAAGPNTAFRTPKAGTYAVKLPKAFTFSSTAGGTPSVPVDCATDAPATLGNIVLAKQVSVVTAKGGTFKKGKVAKVPVKVVNDYSTKGGPVPTGKVVAKEGKKVLGSAKLKAGKAVISLGKKLSVKKHKVVVTYLGDSFTKAGKSKTVIVKIVRR